MTFSFYGEITTTVQGGTIRSRGAVFQQPESGASRQVLLLDHSNICGDLCRMDLTYSGGSLNFSACYDTPLDHVSDYFIQQDSKEKTVELFSCLTKASPAEKLVLPFGSSLYRQHLVHRFLRYPIAELPHPEEGYRKLVVYGNDYTLQGETLCLQPLAVLTYPKEPSGFWRYDCQLRCSVSPPLCAAILSMPFLYDR